MESFAARWLELRPRTKESTNLSYREQVKPFASTHGDLPLADVDRHWPTNGFATSGGLIPGSERCFPFAGRRLRGSQGRKNLEQVALTVGALVATAAFTGMRPAELYGLKWVDIDLRQDEIHVERQYSPRTRTFELPKNGRTRIVVLTPPARDALLALPRPVDSRMPSCLKLVGGNP